MKTEMKMKVKAMPEERDSPSTGWRAVYDAMGVSTPAEAADSGEHEHERSSTEAITEGFTPQTTRRFDRRAPVVDEGT